MIQPKSGVGNTYVCVNMYYHAGSLAASNTKHRGGVVGRCVVVGWLGLLVTCAPLVW